MMGWRSVGGDNGNDMHGRRGFVLVFSFGENVGRSSLVLFVAHFSSYEHYDIIYGDSQVRPTHDSLPQKEELKRISAKSSSMSPRRPNRSRDCTEQK